MLFTVLAAHAEGEAKIKKGENDDGGEQDKDAEPDGDEGGRGGGEIDGVEAGVEEDAHEEHDSAIGLAEAVALAGGFFAFDRNKAGGGAGIEHVVPTRGGDQ